jgi:hypothetical protein
MRAKARAMVEVRVRELPGGGVGVRERAVTTE